MPNHHNSPWSYWRVGLLCFVAACGYRPAEFADRAPVTRLDDSDPIPVPRKRVFIKELHEADVYVRRELVGGLDPRRSPRAHDVNAVDEVPASSWYQSHEDYRFPLANYELYGPPQAPYQVSDEPPSSGASGAYVIIDARGYPYELQPDSHARPGMRTGASAIASRLLHASGYLTPEVYIFRDHHGERVAAMRWPVGIDLGPTPMAARRDDDPNDVIEHQNRRSLRALTMFTAWLGMSRLRARTLRDVYVGEKGKGHVEHWIVGLDGALGVNGYLDAVEFAEDPDRENSNFFLRMFSLGMSPKPPPIVPKTPFDSVGLMSENVVEDDYDPSPPFEPRDHLLPADAYWAAKQIAKVPLSAIGTAVEAAQLEPLVQNWMFQVLNLRRAAIIAEGYNQTTPCELVTVSHLEDGSAEVVAADLAVSNRFAEPWQSSYQVELVDADNVPLVPTRTLVSTSSLLRIPIAGEVVGQGYVVLRLTGSRSGQQLPRAFEVHFRPSEGQLKVVGVTH